VWQKVSLTTPADVVAVIDHNARPLGLSRNSWINRVIFAALIGLETEAAAERRRVMEPKSLHSAPSDSRPKRVNAGKRKAAKRGRGSEGRGR
jgi:hypothetical protein